MKSRTLCSLFLYLREIFDTRSSRRSHIADRSVFGHGDSPARLLKGCALSGAEGRLCSSRSPRIFVESSQDEEGSQRDGATAKKRRWQLQTERRLTRRVVAGSSTAAPPVPPLLARAGASSLVMRGLALPPVAALLQGGRARARRCCIGRHRLRLCLGAPPRGWGWGWGCV